MTSATTRPDAGPHATHDRLLIAAHAAGDLTGVDRDRAIQRIRQCPECAALATELASIARATHELPPATRPTHLDFRLAPETAERLRRGSVWGRLLRPFGRSGGASRPLATAFATLGIAGLLLASLPSMLPLGSAGGAQVPAAGNAGESSEIRQATDDSANPAPPDGAYLTSGSPDTQGGGGSTKASDQGGVPTMPAPNPEGAGGGRTNAGTDTGSSGAAGPGPSPLVLLSVGFLAAGLGLAALRLLARRLA